MAAGQVGVVAEHAAVLLALVLLAAAAAVAGVVGRVLIVHQQHLLAQRDQALADERARADQLALIERRLRMLLGLVPAAIYLDRYDSEGGAFIGAEFVSPRIEDLTGYSISDFAANGDLWAELVHPDDRDRVLARDLERDLLGNDIDREYRLLHRDGHTIWVHDEARVVSAPDEREILSHGYVVDITDRIRLEQQLAHQASHDALTGLANRLLFGERLRSALDVGTPRAARVAVLFLDIDGFKTVNDSLGHAAGDDLLVAVAERLAGAIRPGDTVARLGGDEFAVLLEDVDADEAAATADRLLGAIRPAVSIGSRELQVRASVGIAVSGEIREPAELLRNADAATYRAKAESPGGWAAFEAAMYLDALARFELEAELRAATGRGELRLEYQPTVELATGALTGAEALVRWDHPTNGTVQPAAFIPLAESTGLIVEIGAWVLRSACRQAREWRDRGAVDSRFVMSVNVSSRQLSAELVTVAAAVLAETSLPPANLVVEVTESAVMSDAGEAIQTLEGLRGLGIRVAIDDFGTGYSSFGYLRTLPIDILKIDQSFLASIEAPAERALADPVIRLARALGLRTIAEGVETERQAAILRGLGCEAGQGWLFGQPMRPEHLVAGFLLGDAA